MSDTLPLFPLGTVLFPGLLLPLHIFEDRYRQLVRDLGDRPEPRQFGVIAIRQGRETERLGIEALHEIGCTATLRQVKALADGRYDVVTVGTQRFRLAALDDESKPYLQGQVALLAEETGDEAAAAQAARVVRDGFRAYLGALAERGVTQISAPELPDDPVTLSYLVGASMIIELTDRQALLAEPDALRRLTAERTLLSRELTMLRTLTATPAPDLQNSPYSSN
jgi:Lon protease-like protein